MKFELFIARRLRLGTGQRSGSASLLVALTGIALAVAVMILSIAIVMGFRNEITNKIYQLDAHIKVSNAAIGLDYNIATVNGNAIRKAISADSLFSGKISSASLIIDQPAILKTDTDFEGIIYRGVDSGFDWTFLNNHLTEGRVPNLADTADINEVLISTTLARRLNLKSGDRVPAFFIDQKVRQRNTRVVGIVNTDFDNFDNSLIIGNIRQLQQINGYTADTGHYIAINLKNVDNIPDEAQALYAILATDTYDKQSNTLHAVSHTKRNNEAFFAWLDMLDMNVIVILALMIIVAGFTLITAMLMIVLERIRLVGLLKALGAGNYSIRNIFIALTFRLVLRAVLLGNIIGIGLALAQKYLHIVRLDPTVYYMPYVPIQLSITALILLNAGVLVVAYLTLLGPSHIISTIRPTATMRFE